MVIEVCPIPALWYDHLNTFLAQFFIQLVAVVDAIAHQVLGLCPDYVEVETKLHQSNLIGFAAWVLTASGNTREITVHISRGDPLGLREWISMS